MGEACSIHRVARHVGNSEVKTSLRRLRRRCVYTFKIYHKEIAWKLMRFIKLSRDRFKWRSLLDKIINTPIPQGRQTYCSAE